MAIRVVDASRLYDESDSEAHFAHQTSLILSDARWLRIAGPTAVGRDWVTSLGALRTGALVPLRTVAEAEPPEPSRPGAIRHRDRVVLDEAVPGWRRADDVA